MSTISDVSALEKRAKEITTWHIVKRVLLYLGVFSLAAIMLVPFVWMLSASFKHNKDVFTFPIQWWPKEFVFSNYVQVWKKIPLFTYMLNSFKITLTNTFFQVATSSFAAYGFAKCKFPGRDKLFMLYVLTISVPWYSYMVPQFIMFRTVGLVDTHIVLVMMQTFTAFGVFLVRQFYLSIPNELCEAARIDGLSEYGIYFRIVLPLSKAVLASLTIFSFVTVWNDFMGPMIYLNSVELKTMQVGLRSFIGEYSSEYGLIMAGSIISLVPVLILFLCLQRFFIEGIASTGLKG